MNIVQGLFNREIYGYFSKPAFGMHCWAISGLTRFNLDFWARKAANNGYTIYAVTFSDLRVEL